MHHNLCHETQDTFNFYSAFMFFLKSTNTSSMVEKSSNKSFQTSHTFFFWGGGGGGAPNIKPQMMLFTFNLSPEISTLAPLAKMIESSSQNLFNGKTQHLPCVS